MRKTSHAFSAPRIVQPGGLPQAWWLLVVLVLLFSTLAWQAFEFGRRSAGYDVRATREQVRELEQRVASIAERRDQLREEAARFERSAQVDRIAVESVQLELKDLQQERSRLRQEVEFLKSLVSGDVTILQLDEVRLHALEGDNLFRFHFTVSKRAEDNQKARGRVVLSVSGELDGEETTLEQSEIGVDSSQMVLGFMHFQNIDGQMTLPADFQPIELHLLVQPSDDKFKSFEQSFEWATLQG